MQADPSINTALIVGTIGERPEELLADYPGMYIRQLQPIFTPYLSLHKAVRIPVNLYLVEGNNLKFYVVERHYSTTEPRYPHELHKEVCAYMYALIKMLNVRFIISTSAVGGLNGNNFWHTFTKLNVGSLAVPGTYIDLAGVPVTFATDEWIRTKEFKLSEGHHGVENTICHKLHSMLVGGPVLLSRRSILATSIGPHFESPGEAVFYQRVVRADFLGMHTLIKEWKLVAQVPGVHFLPIVHVTNMPLEDQHGDTSGQHVEEAAVDSSAQLLWQVFRVMRGINELGDFECGCDDRHDIFTNLQQRYS